MRPRQAQPENYAEMYLAAAQDHAPAALEMHDAGRYVLAHYLAGLAVECVLRAYRYRITPGFSGRHDLEALYEAAQFSDVVPEESRPEIEAALIEVARRWSNSHRYRSECALGDYLRQGGFGRKGKFIKESSRRIVNAALILVNQEVLRWNE